MCIDYKYILIVDDNHGVRNLLFEILSGVGYMVEMAADGEEAVKMVASRKPALVLLDVKMPKKNGIEVLRELNISDDDIPVIMMTAYSEMDIVINAKKCGLVRHFLRKPFDVQTVITLVEEVLDERRKTENQVI